MAVVAHSTGTLCFDVARCPTAQPYVALVLARLASVYPGPGAFYDAAATLGGAAASSLNELVL